MHALAFSVLLLAATPTPTAKPAAPYTPAPAADVPGYSASPFLCIVQRQWRMGGYQNALATPAGAKVTAKFEAKKEESDPDAYDAALMAAAPQFTYQTVVCKDSFLEKKSLRELSILRNTIYARWG